MDASGRGGMPRISEHELDRIKSGVSLLDWVRSEGLEPVKRGKDWVVLCPFHAEDTPSCVITPGKNLFNGIAKLLSIGFDRP